MRWPSTALVLFLLGIPMSAAEPKKEAGPANRLAKESSPYLLQHAHNPVDWYPWGAEAFEKAKKEKKVVFLSIGYSSCHWCHVMERESFQDKEIAKILNEHFICIKVDREERPDIDEIYMTALQVIGGSGGWPLSMFLTDDGKPIVGGTYWPKEDRKVDDQVARGFKSILNYMVELKRDQDKELRAQADEVAERTEEVLTRASRLLALVPLGKALAMGPTEAMRDRLDPVHGGIGNPPRFAGTKFPMPPSLQALMRAAHRDNDKALKDLVALTLTKMAEGGIYDQIGGGFHRYSTERTWTVPHFEKMLYDNAQLIELYSEAYSLDPRKLYERVVSESISFVLREMTSPEGAFYSALDADSDGHEGLFYVWTPEEIEKALGEMADAKLLRAVYSVSGPPNFEDKSFVLKINRPLAEIAKEQKLTEDELKTRLEAAKARLMQAREKRNRPFLDTKVLTAWNGQMIAGLARAGEVFRKPEYTQAASRAADFVLAKLRTKEGRLLRTYSQKGDGTFEAKLNAYLDDYAYLIHGLLALHDAIREDRWLKEAVALMETVIRLHGDGDRGGYFFTSSDHEKLFARPKDYHDGVQPSGNSVTARNLVRLWKKTGEEKYRALAEKSFKQFAAALQTQPGSTVHMGEALHLYLELGGKKEEADPKLASPAKLKTSQDVVEASTKLKEPDKDGKREVIVTLKVQKGWHIYANPVENDDLELARTTVEVFADGKKLPAKFTYPKGTVVKDEKVGDYQVYEGEVTIQGMATTGEAKELEVRVKLQACDGNRCLQPATIPLPVK